jgi:hypothetical protein
MNLALGQRVRQFFWIHPEWWSIGLTTVAWAMVIYYAIAHDGHMHHIISFQVEFLNWCLMVVAMMVPLMQEPLRWVAFRSFRYRRHKAMLLFLVGFLLPWMITGVVVAWLRTLHLSHYPLLASGMFGLAALWVLVPVRTRALVFCHRTVPLAPSGRKADRDCVRFSFLIGSSCVVTCGFLMLACILTGHNLIAILGGAMLGVLERRSFRPPRWRIFLGVLVLAVWFLLPISNAMLL